MHTVNTMGHLKRVQMVNFIFYSHTHTNTLAHFSVEMEKIILKAMWQYAKDQK